MSFKISLLLLLVSKNYLIGEHFSDNNLVLYFLIFQIARRLAGLIEKFTMGTKKSAKITVILPEKLRFVNLIFLCQAVNVYRFT